MKSNLVVILLAGMFFLGGYLVGIDNVKTKTITVTKVDTVNIGYDSIFVSSLKSKYNSSIDSLHHKNRKLLSLIRKLKNTQPNVVTDTFYLHDTTYIVSSSAFRLGSDSVNCSGNVYFDMKRFYFNNVKFKYPQHTVINTVYVEKINWKATALGSAVALVVGVLIAH